MAREIGSDFWKIMDAGKRGFTEEISKWGEDVEFLFSGRGAILEALLDVIKQGKKATRVLLPVYCCTSMIEPFVKLGIRVDFYPIPVAGEETAKRPEIEDYDIFLRCHYFGYGLQTAPYSEEELCAYRNRGGVVIEDVTHSLLSDKSHSGNGDYYIASLRKWDGFLSGGICVKALGKLSLENMLAASSEFINRKNEAMELKDAYMKDGQEDKKTAFRDLYLWSEEWLDENYANRKMDDISFHKLECWDTIRVRNRRRENADILYKELADLPWLQFLFSSQEMDTPLFVPIMIKGGIRDELRRWLIEEKIYCPIHWPKPKGCESALYSQELSLICDQRYDREDMRRMAQQIRKFGERICL